jgi:hypothetical protein
MATRSAKRLSRDYSHALTAIFSFMLNNGLEARDLSVVCSRALKKAESKARLRKMTPPGGLATASLVLHAWHRDRRYLNGKATPRAIRLLGPAPSVEALIRVQRKRDDAAVMARHLKRLRLVVPSGRGLYRPTSDAAVISMHNPLVFQHAARALSTVCETVAQNVRSSSRSAPLIERTAEVPDLPKEHVLPFRRFSEHQGRLLLRTINDWLEARRVRRSLSRHGGSAVRAGVHLYAYVDKKRRARKR